MTSFHDQPLAAGEGPGGARRGRRARGCPSPVVAPALLVAIPFLALAPRAALADTLSSGSVSLESRVFEPDDADDTEDVGLALTTRLEVRYRERPWRVVLRGFARLDALDDTRNIFDLEEANGSYSLGRLTLTVGSQVLNWSATEAFHPSDIINSRNFDSDLANPEKIGEPMVELQMRFLQGSIAAYYMPFRPEPKLLPATSRLSFLPAGVELGEPLWLDRSGLASKEAPQGAVRVVQTIGPADVSLHVVDHSDRSQPTFTVDPESNALRPTYHMVTQAGLTYVQVSGGLLVKLEAAMRSFRAPNVVVGMEPVAPQRSHQVAAIGLEYTWATANGHQATFIAEGQAVNQGERIRGQLDPFQRDVLIGYRRIFNDVKGRDILFLFITDAERPNEYVVSAQYGQRLTDQWSVAGVVRSFRLFGRDVNQAQLTLTRSY